MRRKTGKSILAIPGSEPGKLVEKGDFCYRGTDRTGPRSNEWPERWIRLLRPRSARGTMEAERRVRVEARFELMGTVEVRFALKRSGIRVLLRR